MSFPSDAKHPSATPGDTAELHIGPAAHEDVSKHDHNMDINEDTSERTVEKIEDATEPPVTSDLEEEGLTTKIFQFLATATPGTLGGVGVALAAVTYFILGNIGLLLIGAFGGIVAFIQWEARNAEVARAVRGERGIDLLERLLADTRDGKRMTTEERDPDEEERALSKGFDNFQPETGAALNEFVDAVIRDYVKWWYGPIMPSDKFFPLACRKVLTSFLVSISSHLSRKRPADAFLDFLTNTSSIVIVFFSELSTAFADLPTDSKVAPADTVYDYLASKPESNLANLLNQRQQAGKFRMVAEDLLGFLERPTYECDPARVFLREILAGVVLEMSLQTCSKPEWINGWIVYLLEAGEPDFSQAIDVGMQTGPNSALDNAFLGIDGNVGNIGLSKGNKNSFEMEKARRKETMVHKKKLSKADEEMETAMEEMKRMNEMIAQEETRRRQRSQSQSIGSPGPSVANQVASVVSEKLTDAFNKNADNLNANQETVGKSPSDGPALPPRRSETSGRPSPKDLSTTDRASFSSRSDATRTPLTPDSSAEWNSQTSSPQPRSNAGSRFTSFDQIVAPGHDEVESEDSGRQEPPPLTLHNATITVLDEIGDNRIRTKPTWDYLIQIEPATTHHPGWMIVRKYSDFEPLHEVLRRIANVSGATAFTEQHTDLPNWKVHTRNSLRGELERYLRDACWFRSLAESEGMRKFLERDNRFENMKAKSGFQAIEKLGKNVFDVLTSAPLEGSKAVVGGVTGVLGNMGLGQRKSPSPALPTSSSLQDVTAASRLSMSSLRFDSSASLRKRDSMDSQRSSVISMQPNKIAPMERRPSYQSQSEAEPDSLRPSLSDRWERSVPLSGKSSREHSRASSLAPLRSPSTNSLDGMQLPPPPDAMPDDYVASPVSPQTNNGASFQSHSRSQTLPNIVAQKSNGNGTTASATPPVPPAPAPPLPSRPAAKQHSSLSEPETRVAVELLFAIINELYTLSSAWNIRRTLLAAAKSFLLRPGNPSLIYIQSMIQTSVIEANASDEGIAYQLRKLRENTLPTEEERAAWPEEMSAEEKEKLRIKARKMLIERGVPAALTGVMGQNATTEALGRVFDCLQEEKVARGLMFGILLQAVRIVTH